MDILELNFDGFFNIDRVESQGRVLNYTQTESKLFVDLAQTAQPGESASVTVFYAGRPIEAEHPPWDGGFTWEQTPSGTNPGSRPRFRVRVVTSGGHAKIIRVTSRVVLTSILLSPAI